MPTRLLMDIKPKPAIDDGRNGWQTQSSISVVSQSPTADRHEGYSRMNLLFITHTSNAINKTVENHNPRDVNRRAQQNALAKRKQTRPKRLPARSSQEYRNSSLSEGNWSQALSNKQRWLQLTSLTTTIDLSQDYRAPGVRSYLDSYRMDPFQTGKVMMTAQDETVFMYYFTTIMPVVEPVQAEREEYHQWLVPLAVSEPALLFALIGCMAYDIEQASVIGFGPPHRRNMTTERVQYRIQAIHALNERLSDPKKAIQSSTLIAVHFLLWQEIFAGDECVHLDGVQKLLKLRGGFEGIQRKAIEAIMVGCTWRAVRTRTKPVLPMVDDDLPVSRERFVEILSKSEPSVARQGEGLLTSEIRQHFDPEMIQLLEDARIAWVCFEQIGICDFLPQEKRHFSIKRVNIDHRLLSYPFDHFGAYRPIQEICRQAFIMYSNAHYNVVQPSSKIARCLVEDLKTALEATDLRSCWGTAHKALLWVLFLGAHMSFGQRERPWFVTVLARVAQLLASRDWFRVRAELVHFYYSDRVFQESFRKIWDEVEVMVSSLPNWF